MLLTFQISLRSDEFEEPGEIPVNVTATITEVNVPYPLGSSDSEEIIVTIIEYQYCGASIGQGGGVFDGGDEISISAAINCNSNKGEELSSPFDKKYHGFIILAEWICKYQW